MDRKVPSRPSSFLFSFSNTAEPKSNHAPHQPQEEDEEKSSVSGPHHMVSSFHSRSWECSSMSLFRRFLLQYLTAMKTPSRTKMMPQAPPTAAARMLISERETRKTKVQSQSQTTAEC